MKDRGPDQRDLGLFRAFDRSGDSVLVEAVVVVTVDPVEVAAVSLDSRRCSLTPESESDHSDRNEVLDANSHDFPPWCDMFGLRNVATTTTSDPLSTSDPPSTSRFPAASSSFAGRIETVLISAS